MFEVVIHPTALGQLRRLRRVDAIAILDALDRHLRHAGLLRAPSRRQAQRGSGSDTTGTNSSARMSHDRKHDKFLECGPEAPTT